jgi:iron complex outermembrane receptor protein
MKFKQRMLLSSAAGLMSLLAAEASAAPLPGAAASDAVSTVGEVVVTAEKREVSLQKAPVSVSVFTGAQRDLKGIETIQDITNFTPGLVYNSQLDRASLRGVGRLTNQMTVDGAVAVYSDNFYTTSTTEAALDSLFVERTEVLRGPQGTLFGRNAIGGLINVISRRPTDEWYAEVRTTQGNYGTQQYEGAVSGPITDGLNFRLAGSKSNQYDGFFSNTVPNKPSEGSAANEYYIAGYLDGKLGSNLDFWAKYATEGWENHGGPGTRVGYEQGHFDETNLVDINTTPLFYNPAYGYTDPIHTQTGPETDNPALSQIRDFAANTQLTFNLHNVNIFDTQFTYHFPSFDVKYTGGIYTYGYDDRFGGTGTSITSYQVPLAANAVAGAKPLTVYPTLDDQATDDERWFSNEVTLSSTTNGPLQWIAGAYFFRQDSYSSADQFAPNQPQIATPVLGPANPLHGTQLQDYRSTTSTEAGYGQVDWAVTSTLKLTGGLRYTSDQKTAVEEERLVAFEDSAPLSVLGVGAARFGAATKAADITQFFVSCPSPASCKTAAPGVISGTAANPGGTTFNAAGFAVRDLAANSSAVTGTAGVEWTPDSKTLAYFRYSRGYKAVGLDPGALTATPEALPETLDSYEIGLKKTFWRRLVVDASIYYYNYQDIQAPIGVPITSAVLGTTIIQTNLISIPQARLDGFELSSIWSPIDPLQLTLDYSYNDSSVQSRCSAASPTSIASGACFIDSQDPAAQLPGARPVGAVVAASAVQSVRGAQLPETPRNKVALNGAYTLQFQPGSLTLSASYIWRDVAYASIFNRDYNKAPTWDQVDLRATWKSRTDKYEVIGYVKNLFDSVGYQAAAVGSLVGVGASTIVERNFDLTDPRLFGVELHYKFF